MTDGDFVRAKDRLLKVVLISGKNHRGRLVGWDSVHITLDEGRGKTEDVLRENIAKATIEVEFKNK